MDRNNFLTLEFHNWWTPNVDCRNAFCMRCAIWSPKDQRIDRVLTIAGIKTFSFRKLTRGFYAALQFFSGNIIYQKLNTRHKCQSQYTAQYTVFFNNSFSHYFTPLSLTEYVTWLRTWYIYIGITRAVLAVKYPAYKRITN